MVIVPEQTEIVKQIFADTLAGKSTHAISKELNERGIPTKKSGRWTPGTINGIIKIYWRCHLPKDLHGQQF